MVNATQGEIITIITKTARVDLTSLMPDLIWSISMIKPENINMEKIMTLDPA